MSAKKQLSLVCEFVCQSCLLHRLGGIIDAEVDASLAGVRLDIHFSSLVAKFHWCTVIFRNLVPYEASCANVRALAHDAS